MGRRVVESRRQSVSLLSGTGPSDEGGFRQDLHRHLADKSPYAAVTASPATWVELRESMVGVACRLSSRKLSRSLG